MMKHFEYEQWSSFSLPIIALLFVAVTSIWYISGKMGNRNVDRDEKAQTKPSQRVNFPKTLTLEELSEYDGVRNLHPGNPICISICGTVYDVTSNETGRQFYGPDASYSIFAGRDATCALAKMSKDQTLVNLGKDTWDNLTEKENESLSSWIRHFESKYQVVGHLKM